MSARKSWTIHCDGCGESDGGDLGSETAQDKRDQLARDGWSVNAPGGTDWCYECKDNGTMRAGLQLHYLRRRFSRG